VPRAKAARRLAKKASSKARRLVERAKAALPGDDDSGID
jgi:hypothetical protein